MRRGRVAAALGVAGAIACSEVRADTPPSIWDMARDPAARDFWALHVRVERLLHPPEPEDPLVFELQRGDELRLAEARALLEDADAAHSPDVRLRFDLGIVYERIATLTRRHDLEQKVVDVLAPALEKAPDHPASTAAFQSLVYAYAKLDRPHDELETWRRFIPRIADDPSRVGPLMNEGEAEMRLGLIDEALATFREGLELCETLSNADVNETYALTLWDLALALDRSGDPAAALSAAAKARTWTWTAPVTVGLVRGNATVTGWDAIRDESGDVFFVPEWERQWYLALGFASAAISATDPRDAAPMWRKAEEHWDAYVTRSSASPKRDRWLPIARARLAHAHAARVEAEMRAAKLPARKTAGDGSWPDE